MRSRSEHALGSEPVKAGTPGRPIPDRRLQIPLTLLVGIVARGAPAALRAATVEGCPAGSVRYFRYTATDRDSQLRQAQAMLKREEKIFADTGNAPAAKLLASKIDGLGDVATECLFHYVTSAMQAADPTDIITILELPPHTSN